MFSSHYWQIKIHKKQTQSCKFEANSRLIGLILIMGPWRKKPASILHFIDKTWKSVSCILYSNSPSVRCLWLLKCSVHRARGIILKQNFSKSFSKHICRPVAWRSLVQGERSIKEITHQWALEISMVGTISYRLSQHWPLSPDCPHEYSWHCDTLASCKGEKTRNPNAFW